MKRLILALCVSAVLAAASTSAGAWTNSEVIISGTAGSGANTAYIVFDFGTNSYAFTYSFDGVKTAFQALEEINAQVPGFDYTYTDYGGGAIFVDTVTYWPEPTTGGSPPSYWSYWLGDKTVDDIVWSYSGVGAGSRQLSDGDYDGWSFVPDWNNPANQPDVPLVPEPGSFAVLATATGLFPLILRKKV